MAWTVRDTNELWRRRAQGETITEIAAALDRWPAEVFKALGRDGGVVRPLRKRRKGSLTLAEREEISRGIAAEESDADIARRLSRSPSTVSRELKSNGGRPFYRAATADEHAWKKSQRPKPCKLETHARLRMTVARLLAKNWSPVQIAGALKRNYPGNAAMQISHETIYRTLFIQARGALKKELLKHLRLTRPMRRSKKSQKARSDASRKTRIPDALKISERPPEVTDRAVPGHWEGDLLCGKSNSQIVTLVERRTRYVMLAKADTKNAAEMSKILSKQILKLPRELRRSLTWDRGSEMANHKEFTMATDMTVYFCDPHSPWQRGSNENTNGLLRQYFPKGTSVAHFTQAQLNAIARELNERPRQTLDFQSPAAVFAQLVAQTD